MKNRRDIGALASMAFLLAFGIQHASSQTTGSGFLSQYTRLGKAGSIRDHYLSYTDPDIPVPKFQSLCILPVVRFPADARFDGIDDAMVAELLAQADGQLRTRLGARYRLTESPDNADVTLQIALTNVGVQPEGKTAIDLIPMRLITGTVKDSALGKSLEATAMFETRLIAAGVARPWRESIYVIESKPIGRAADAKMRITANALKPAIDKWAAALADQITAKP